MPHCVLEYSKDLDSLLDFESLLIKVKEAMFASQLFALEAIKIRAISYPYYHIDKMSDHFLHVRLSLLSGRSITQKQKLSELRTKGGDVFAHLTEQVKVLDAFSCLYHRLRSQNGIENFPQIKFSDYLTAQAVKCRATSPVKRTSSSDGPLSPKKSRFTMET